MADDVIEIITNRDDRCSSQAIVGTEFKDQYLGVPLCEQFRQSISAASCCFPADAGIDYVVHVAHLR